MERIVGGVESLDDHVARIADAGSPGAAFGALLEASRLAVPRAAVFLLREGRFKGMGSVGYAEDVAARQHGAMVPADRGWLASLRQADPLTWAIRPEGADGPDFGQPAAAEAAGIPVELGGKIVAIVLAERHRDESPWDPTVLRLLVRVMRLRLSLDLAVRRASTATPAAPDLGPAAPASDVTGLEAVEEHPSDDDRRASDARRYARLVATDIRLYNEEAVMLGRRQGDLATRLAEQMQRGRELFKKRFADLGDEGLRVLHDAFVRVLAGGDESLLPAVENEPATR